MEQQKNSRLSFLKAGLLVGGALYADSAAAVAGTGGRRFVEPDVYLFPNKTPISKFVPGSYLPGNTGALTLADLAGLAEMNEAVLRKIDQKFSDVTLGDIGDCVAYAINQLGSTTPIFQQESGENILAACCCCTTCVTIKW